MTKQNKTKLQFILGGILFLTFAVAACNGSDKDTQVVVKDSTVTKIKTTVHDSTDTMEKIKGKVSPTPGGGN